MPTAAVWCVPYFGTVGFYKQTQQKKFRNAGANLFGRVAPREGAGRAERGRRPTAGLVFTNAAKKKQKNLK